MKKYQLLVAPLLSVAFLVSCGGSNTPSEDVKFSVQETSVTVTDNTAVIHLDWTPSGDVIEFSNFTFTLTNDPITTYVTPGTAGDRPLAITITFSSTLLRDDEGKLKFHYNDKTAKKEGDAEVKGIAVKIPPITEKRTLHFSGVNCVLKDEDDNVISSDITVDKGTELTYFIDGTDGYLKPKDNQIDFKITDTADDFEGEHSYNPDTGEVSVTLTENVTIYASGADPYIDNEDEFKAALAFTGEEYLQMKRSVGEGEVSQLDECSPNIYHGTVEMHMTEPEPWDNYQEGYIYKINNSTYKKIIRLSEEAQWGDWEPAYAEDWINPQKIAASIADDIGEIEFDSSKYDPDTHSYTLKNSSEVEFVFKFENKKLTYLKLPGNEEMTFTYNQEAPELPIDPPTE